MLRHTLTGNIHRRTVNSLHARSGTGRDILVYLPPGYRRFSRRRYPVFYLQDGPKPFSMLRLRSLAWNGAWTKPRS